MSELYSYALGKTVMTKLPMALYRLFLNQWECSYREFLLKWCLNIQTFAFICLYINLQLH